MEPLKFPSANTIPIIGQPFVLKQWTACVNVVCNCEAKEPILIVGLGTPAFCPACKRGFAIGQINYNARTGQSQIGIGVVVASQEKAPS